jgi:hypothetical protein
LLAAGGAGFAYHGDFDWGGSAARALAEALPNSRSGTLEGQDHNVD